MAALGWLMVTTDGGAIPPGEVSLRRNLARTSNIDRMPTVSECAQIQTRPLGGQLSIEPNLPELSPQ